MSAVVHVITTLARGGAQRTALELACGLHTAERPQWLIAGEPGALDDEARARLRHRFITVRALSNARSVAGDAFALGRLATHLDRIARGSDGALIVHTHSIKAGLLGRLAARSVRAAKIVHTLHGFAFDVVGASLTQAVERFAASLTDVQLYVSDADRETAARLGIRARADRVVRAGVDVDHFFGAAFDDDERARVRAQLGVPGDAPLAVTVANFKAQKDPLLHVEVLAAWRKLRPGARLLFLGEGPLRKSAEDRARALGVGDAFLAPGAVDDTRPYLAAADAMLLASAWEGLPMSVLEGIAAGLPVVVKDAGWGADLAFAPSLRRLPVSQGPAHSGDTAGPDAYAAAVDAAAHTPRAPLALPRAFTRAGMLDDVAAVYDDLIPGSRRARAAAALRRRDADGARRAGVAAR